MSSTTTDPNNLDPSNIEASRVNGTNVYNRTGEKLGSVHDLVIGKRDGKVKYAILSFGGFLGMGEDYHPLPWEKLDYEEDRGGYVCDLDKEKLEAAPSYSKSESPDWEDREYGRSVDSHYGVNRNAP
jgi:sporulation protein YlmC with PRC-barrel domain